MKDKISKKATSKIINLVQSIDPKRSKLTTFDEAWEVISEAWGLSGSLKSDNATTTFALTTDQDTMLHKFTWDNKDVFCDGDWDWTKVFDEVIKYIMKNKLNNPKNIKKLAKQYVDDAAAVCLSNTAKKLAKTAQISKIDNKQHKSSGDNKNSVKSKENAVKIDSTTQTISIESLKKKKSQLYYKIRSDKRKGRDVAGLEKEYDEIITQLKKFKK